MPMEQPPSKETRVPVNLRIKFRSETIEQFVERYAVDVSRGGIFIRTREPLAVGTQLKFDFQLQDTSPLMAGEGTVVWIREHDPNRAGVTPGMGVRFDKLTPASQPVLDKILADKGKREPSGPNANTVSGKSGLAAMPVRRPSSTFSAVEPLLGAAPAGATLPGASGSGLMGGVSPGPAANPFAASSPSGLTSSPLGRPTQPLSSLSSPPPGAPKPAAGAPGAGALPTMESQSALNRLATGPNLSAFGPVSAPRTKSPVPLPKTGDGSGRVTGTSGTPAVPTLLEDSERTQIADGLPEFANEQPTHVGSPALSDLAASRSASITATSKRSPTPPPQPKLSLDEVAAPAASVHADATAVPSRTTSPDGGLGSGAGAMRTTSPDGTAGADAAAISPGRLSSSQPVVGPHPNPGSLASDLAQTVPASARISAVTSAVQTNTPHATPRVEPPKKKRTGLVIVVGGLAGAVLAVGGWIALKQSSHEPEEAAAVQAAAPAPAPAAPPVAAPEGAKTDPAAANPAGEAKVREAKPGEPKPGETAAAEPKPGEPKAAEAKPAAAAEAKPAEAQPEAKPADTKVAVAESAAAAKAGKRPRPVPHKKGAAAGKADDAADAADDGTNVVRIISLPTGADVLIDGQAVGKTPFISKDIDPASPHALTVRKDGFDNHEHMVSPGDWVKGKGAGQSLRVTVKLHKGAGAGGEAKAGGQDKDDKAEKPAAPPPTEPAKTEAPPAAETP
jgi:uncharacterized protein (TIGR02266 family)